MNRTTKNPPRIPTTPVRLKTAGYRRRWKPAGPETRSISTAEPTPEPPATPPVA